MKSFEFFKPTLATTLAIVLAWLPSVRTAQAGYTVTLQQVGRNVVAAGSGPIDLTGLFFFPGSFESPEIHPSGVFNGGARIRTGPTSSSVDRYRGPGTMGSFGSGLTTTASSGSGDMVGVFSVRFGNLFTVLSVPTGYVSGTPLSDSATYNNATLASLGVTPGTYVWKWGTGANQNFTLKILTPGPGTATVADFNGDGHPDLVLRNAATRQTVIWHLNNNVFLSGALGPTLPVGWGLRGAADFNGDIHPDYGLFNAATRQTAIWYLNNNVRLSGAFGPTLPGASWSLVGVADFNGDGHPDYVLYNASTRQTAIWHLNNNVFVSGAFGPTLPAGWGLRGVADFDGDGHPDYALFNSATRQTAIWYLSGSTFIRGAFGPTLPSGWALVATKDFNGNGKPDYVLYNAATRKTVIWYLNNNVFVSSALGPTLPTGWSLVGE